MNEHGFRKVPPRRHEQTAGAERVLLEGDDAYLAGLGVPPLHGGLHDEADAVDGRVKLAPEKPGPESRPGGG